MFVAAQFTGLEGKYVKIEDTVRSFKKSWKAKYDDVQASVLHGRHNRGSSRKGREDEGERVRKMLPEAIELVIVTPEKQLLARRPSRCNARRERYLVFAGARAAHRRKLGIGELSYHDKAQESTHIAIVRGFAESWGPCNGTWRTPNGGGDLTLQRAKMRWLAPKSRWLE